MIKCVVSKEVLIRELDRMYRIPEEKLTQEEKAFVTCYENLLQEVVRYEVKEILKK